MTTSPTPTKPSNQKTKKTWVVFKSISVSTFLPNLMFNLTNLHLILIFLKSGAKALPNLILTRVTDRHLGDEKRQIVMSSATIAVEGATMQEIVPIEKGPDRQDGVAEMVAGIEIGEEAEEADLTLGQKEEVVVIEKIGEETEEGREAVSAEEMIQDLEATEEIEETKMITEEKRDVTQETVTMAVDPTLQDILGRMIGMIRIVIDLDQEAEEEKEMMKEVVTDQDQAVAEETEMMIDNSHKKEWAQMETTERMRPMLSEITMIMATSKQPMVATNNKKSKKIWTWA